MEPTVKPIFKLKGKDGKVDFFKSWQWQVIICSMIGYAVFYFVRKNFSFAIPMIQDAYPEITKAQLGAILSAGGIIYGVSKLINGIIGDRTNARWHLVLGLGVCVAVNFLFGWTDKLTTLITGATDGPDFIGGFILILSVLYIVNQIFQGCGFAPCNHLMVNWVPPHELATKMSIWNTSHSVGAFVASVICGYLTSWQLCFWVPACLGLVGVFFIIATLRDTPKSVGLQELPKVEGELDESKGKDKKAFRKFLVKRVFLNPVVWILALTDLFVYVVRFAVLDWGPSMLQDMGLSPQLSGWTVGIFEVAGCLGMIFAGYVSDKFFKSRSQRVCAIEMVIVALCLVALHYIQDWHQPVLFLIVLALAGFFLYGPQALLGVVASNEVSKKAASSAVGIIGFMSYLSTLITGYPLGKFADKFGWHPIFILMAAVAVIGFLLVVTLWNLKDKARNTETIESE
ncbi:MAG: MFS transporter [Bacteroidales bacterium]|nr:MFS transporter [Bacteroidales bacterium]MBR6932700.1 MFS transporter [Bacteroidales bacterium]